MQAQKLQPIFLENLSLSFAGFKIGRFAYHKHSDQSDKVASHKHAHSQFLLYLRGRGIQTTSSGKQPVMRGSFLYFPPQTLHGFIKSMESPPLSLVFDFKEKKPFDPKPIFKNLAPAILSEIERTLHRTIESADLGQAQSPRIAAEILTLFAILHDSLDQGNESNQRIHPVTCGFPQGSRLAPRTGQTARRRPEFPQPQDPQRIGTEFGNVTRRTKTGTRLLRASGEEVPNISNRMELRLPRSQLFFALVQKESWAKPQAMAIGHDLTLPGLFTRRACPPSSHPQGTSCFWIGGSR